MAVNVENEVSTVRESVYARDVRSAIADGLSKVAGGGGGVTVIDSVEITDADSVQAIIFEFNPDKFNEVYLELTACGNSALSEHPNVIVKISTRAGGDTIVFDAASTKPYANESVHFSMNLALQLRVINAIQYELYGSKSGSMACQKPEDGIVMIFISDPTTIIISTANGENFQPGSSGFLLGR